MKPLLAAAAARVPGVVPVGGAVFPRAAIASTA